MQSSVELIHSSLSRLDTELQLSPLLQPVSALTFDTVQSVRNQSYEKGVKICC